MNPGFPINFLEESEITTETETNEIGIQVKVETCSVGTQYDLSDFGGEKEIVEEKVKVDEEKEIVEEKVEEEVEEEVEKVEGLVYCQG